MLGSVLDEFGYGGSAFMVRSLLIRNVYVLFVLVVLAGLAPLASAQLSAEEEAALASSSTPAAVAELPDDLLPGAQIVGDGQPLSLGEAVALGIRNSLDIEVERFAPLIAETRREGAWGAYNPLLSADATYNVTKSPNTFALNDVSANRNRVQGGGVGIEQLIPYLGSTIGLEFRQTDTVTRSAIQALDPQFDASFFVTARVPVARNLIWNEAWTNVKRTGLASAGSNFSFRESVMNTVQATVTRYWNLVAARDRVRVAQKSLETARALLEQTETQFEVGVVSRVEVVESEAGVAERESDLIRDANSYRNAQDQLIDIVLGSDLSVSMDLEFFPTEDPSAYQVRDVNLSSAIQEAFLKRPELKIAENEIEQRELELKFAKNQRLPQLDANIRFGFVGIAGRGNGGLSPAFGDPPGTSSRADASRDFFTGEGSDNLSVTGNFSIPIPNTAARKGVQRGKFELRRAESLRRRSEQVIILEVRDAARTLLSSAQGIDAAERRRLSAAEQLRAQRIRLEHGESTPFEVLQREERLVEAENLQIIALQTYRTAEAALDRAQGTILEVYAVEIEEIQGRDQ